MIQQRYGNHINLRVRTHHPGEKQNFLWRDSLSSQDLVLFTENSILPWTAIPMSLRYPIVYHFEFGMAARAIAPPFAALRALCTLTFRIVTSRPEHQPSFPRPFLLLLHWINFKSTLFVPQSSFLLVTFHKRRPSILSRTARSPFIAVGMG